MRRGNSGLRRSSRGPNSKEWDGTSAGVLAAGAGTTGFWIIDPVQAIDDYESPTVIRLLVAWKSYVVSAPTNLSVHGFGIYVATGDEDDVTVPTLLWDPVGDEQSDWMYRVISSTTPRSVAGELSTNGGADIMISVKTKRKIPRGAGLLGVFGHLALGGAVGTVDQIANVRALLISG